MLVDGPSVRAIGLPFPTRMIVVRLTDGALWVNSPVHVSPELLASLPAVGPVKYLVAPTRLHVWRLEEWHTLFPDAELWGPPQIPRQFRHLPFRGMLNDEPPRGWSEDLDQLVFRGNLFVEEVHFFHRASRSLIVADFLQNHRPVEGRPFVNTLCRLFGAAYPRGGVPYDIRWSFLDRKRARQSLEKLLSWDFENLIVAHGVCIRTHGREFVERAFRWLK
ncbi:MAG TPA: DUF4336 domain-containing protein [Chthoniobacter sp.]